MIPASETVGCWRLAEGEDHGQQWRREQDSPERDEDAQNDRTEEGCPPGDLRCAMQHVRTDNEAFEDDDQAIEAENKAEAPLVVSAEGDRENRADKRDHASEGRDDLEQAAEDRPERSEGHMDQLQPDKPQNTDDERIECGGSPPVEQRSARCFERGHGGVVSDVHTNLTVPERIRPAEDRTITQSCLFDANTDISGWMRCANSTGMENN